MRYALGIEYDGARYHGWQRQEMLITVQGCVERALSGVADHRVSIFCAGRTDTGVHAVGQVVHFESDARREDNAWVLGANCNLPADIRVRWSQRVDDEFHARFSAMSRRYLYIINNRPIRPAIFRRGMSWHRNELDIKRMQPALQYLMGEHDFSGYRAINCQSKTPVRVVHSIRLERQGDLIIIDITANGFLHHMVRNIAGVLFAIGEGKKDPIWAKEIIECKERKLAGVTAPPDGLYFMSVKYPEEFALPQPSAKIWGLS